MRRLTNFLRRVGYFTHGIDGTNGLDPLGTIDKWRGGA
jgi:hypothetical protein